MLSDAEYQYWLEQSAPSERCLLIAIESDAGLIRLGWPAFINRPGDQYPNLFWDDVLSELPEFTSADGAIEVGDLEIVWPEQINELFSRHWRGRQYRMWLGSQSWPFDDFKVLATGRIESVERIAAHQMRFNFLSPVALLEVGINEATEQPTEQLNITVTGGTEPRDFDPTNTSIPLPARYTWQQPDVLFTLPAGDNARSPEL